MRKLFGKAIGWQVLALGAIASVLQAAEPYSRGTNPYNAPGRVAAPPAKSAGQGAGTAYGAYGAPRQLSPEVQARPMNPAAKPRTSPGTTGARADSGTSPAPQAAGTARATEGSRESQPANVPSPEQALRLAPVQPDVDYSRPADADVPRCKVIARRTEGAVGWVVEDPAGLPLRRFVDTNGDNKVDQWSYFKDGLEVYRDIDADYNGKADQYRWFNTAGSRWAVDRDEDGLIDAWHSISAEEVTAEVIAALATQDAARFARVALNADDLKGLGLGPGKSQDLAEKIATLGIKFKEAARAKGITEKTRWVHFSGSQPGIVPAGTEGSTKDIQVYENVVAIAQTGGDHVQVQIGTLVRVGDAWKVIDVPQATGEGDTRQADAGYFFRVAADWSAQRG
ncbi:MAG: hypothetical protein NUV77_14705, partial [Thermoguttaceae bacterium]|nr:hypothetical protein [Thermoguttaceae bacterium]